MLYYANGGPGPASKLLRVHAPEDGDFATWRRAPADAWQVKGGWQPYPHAHTDIQMLGEFFMIDASQVVEVQAQMLAEFVAFH
jgi:hypothetical protein